MNDNCIFCRITDGVIPSFKLYEDDNFLSILDIAPSSKGHAIIFPKKHCRNLFDADDKLLSGFLPAAKKIAASIKEAIGCEGVNLLQNNEAAAGQTIYHLHMHIIPRYENDDCTIEWNKITYEDGEAAELAEKIINKNVFLE